MIGQCSSVRDSPGRRRRLRYWVAGLALLGACEGAPGPEPSVEGVEAGGCGDLDCRSGLRISLVAQARYFVGGAYTVTTIADGDVQTCMFALARGVDACGEDVTCLMSTTCDATFNFAWVPNTINFEVSSNRGDPESVEINVMRGHARVAEAQYRPAYVDYAPNGSDCAPLCRVAAAELWVQ